MHVKHIKKLSEEDDPEKSPGKRHLTGSRRVIGVDMDIIMKL